jgi:ATP-binding cassette, subfamily F, member 3
MKMLAGRLPLMSGTRKEGQNVQVSFFSQDQDDLLSSTKTVWQEVFEVAPGYIVPQLRTLLGCFLFSGDTVEKSVSVLSGGERSRLVLCKLLLSPANCLLLDEPTNHLDIRSKDILMDSLRDYGGTLVFVSHDRYFLDGLATKVLDVGNGTVVQYLGNYEDYLFKKKKDAESPATASPAIEEKAREGEGGPVRERPRKKANPLKIRQLQDKIEGVESRIHTHETRIAVLAQRLASEDLYRDYTLFRATMEEHDQLQGEMAGLMQEWEALQTDLSRLTDEG